MTRPAVAALAVLAAACAPKLYFNQSFLTSEELKVGKSGFASLKSTGERFDLSLVRAQEPRVERVVVLKVHGALLLTGEGFRHLWRLEPAGGDAARLYTVDLEPGPQGFTSPTLEPSGDCALIRWAQQQAFVTADGDVHAKSCEK